MADPLRARLAALVRMFELHRDQCHEQARRQREPWNELAGKEWTTRAGVWDLAARCVENEFAALLREPLETDAETKLRALRSVCHECRRVDADDFHTPALAECIRCGELDCPHNEPLHYHHDGCPACHGTAAATPDTGTTITRELRARDHRLGRHPSGSVEECPLCARAAASEEKPEYCGVPLKGGWCKRAKGHDGDHVCS